MAVVNEKTFFVSAREWQKKGTYYDVLDKEMFVIDIGNKDHCLVILHGYLSSSYDFYKVVDGLKKKYRVVIPDLINFGLSEVVSQHYFSIIDQADYVTALIDKMNLKNISVLGHDYGIAIGQELLARYNADLLPFTINEFIYCNGNIPIKNSFFLDTAETLKSEIAKKLTGMLATYGIYKRNILEMLFDNSIISDDEIFEMWKLLKCNNGISINKFIYDYLRERKIFLDRWITSLLKTDAVVKVIWGISKDSEKDNYPSILANKVEKNDVLWITQSGHYPMLENPEIFIEIILNN